MPDEESSPSLPRKHLRRLDRIWVDDPIYFVTSCVDGRAPMLAAEPAHAILREVWLTGQELHGWRVGSYTVMPDHVHFFCAPTREAVKLGDFVGKWKEWSSKFFKRRLGWTAFNWQEGFFDHLLRSEGSYTQKWLYVRQNPVRAGFVTDEDDWPFHGSLNAF